MLEAPRLLILNINGQSDRNIIRPYCVNLLTFLRRGSRIVQCMCESLVLSLRSPRHYLSKILLINVPILTGTMRNKLTNKRLTDHIRSNTVQKWSSIYPYL